jgi:hypothetical protein
VSRAPDPILWRRLDLPGHDTASIRLTDEGTVLTGMAVFLQGAPTALAYTVRCDSAWRTVEGVVRGWRGPAPVDLRFRRDADGRWTLNEVPCPAVAGCLDLDLSFTPATNLLPLRRLDLDVGQSAEVRSAWLQWPDMQLTLLTQRYTRQAPTEYGYEADVPGPTTFSGPLLVEPGGWVRDYAGLWRAEPSAC